MPHYIPPPEPPIVTHVQSDVSRQPKLSRQEGSGRAIASTSAFLDGATLQALEQPGANARRVAPSPAPQDSPQSNAQTSSRSLVPLSVGRPVSGRLLLVAQERNGEQNFEFSIPAEETAPTGTDSPAAPAVEPLSVVEVMADRQEYNEQQEVITARGNVEIRFARAVLTADRLQVNLPNRVAVAQGNVTLRRGEQVLRGERFEYLFFQNTGSITNAGGEVYLPVLGRDTAPITTDAGNIIPEQPLSDRLAAEQSLQRVTTEEGYKFVLGSIRDLTIIEREGLGLPTVEAGGQVNRLRFQAEKIEFDEDTWQATNLSITNDPFSPPELEIRADTATFRNVEPQVDELVTTNSRVVFDGGFSLPLFQERLVFDRRPRQPGIISFKFDGEERGGLFVERSFNLINTEQVNWSISPQYLVQRALFPGILNEDGGDVIGSSSFGLETTLDVSFSPRTTFRGIGSLTSLELDELDDELRANLRLQHRLGELESPYIFSLEYNYRERLFNGSLGFQRVQSSFGAVIASPELSLGESGVTLAYQASIQNINARSDRDSLLGEGDDEGIVNLTRYQGAASVEKDFLLWEGEALPATAEEGLRYSPAPVLPFIELKTGIAGVASFYSNGDTQPSLRGSIGLEGQFGHFSRSFLDYTGFNVTYTQGIRGDESPFRFDRFVDQTTVSLGITQQVYGPFRAGFQASFSIDEGDNISTDYFLEYSRRSYNVLLRYNPVLEIGSINFRVNDFNWVGDPEPYSGSGIRPVIQGVERDE